jgi:hypothetical protein
MLVTSKATDGIKTFRFLRETSKKRVVMIVIDSKILLRLDILRVVGACPTTPRDTQNETREDSGFIGEV